MLMYITFAHFPPPFFSFLSSVLFFYKYNQGTQNCAEAMLDIEYIGAIGGAIPLTDVYSAQYSLFDLTTTLMNLPKAS